MNELTRILDQTFSTFLGFEKVKNCISNAKTEDLSFGFAPDFNEKQKTFQLFLSLEKGEETNISCTNINEELEYGITIKLLKNNFYPDLSVYNTLPTYFEAEDYLGIIWSVKKFGQYYLCSDVAEFLFGSFRFTNSEKVANFWVEQKIATYTNNIATCEKQIAEAENKIRQLKEREIPRYQESLIKFNISKFELWLMNEIKDMGIKKGKIILLTNEASHLKMIIEVDLKDSVIFTLAVLNKLKNQAIKITGLLTLLIEIKFRETKILAKP